MYSKPITFLVGGINIYASIFYPFELLPWLSSLLKISMLWKYGDVVVSFFINLTSLSGSLQLFCGCINEVFMN